MKPWIVMNILLIKVHLFANSLDNSITGSVINGWIQGEIVATDSSMDVAISGSGFISLQKSTNQIFYTQALSIRMDKDGDLAQKSSGYKILHISERERSDSRCQQGYKPFEGQPERPTTLTASALNNDGEIEGIYFDGSLEKIAHFNLAIFQNQRRLKLRNKKHKHKHKHKHKLLANSLAMSLIYRLERPVPEKFSVKAEKK